MIIETSLCRGLVACVQNLLFKKIFDKDKKFRATWLPATIRALMQPLKIQSPDYHLKDHPVFVLLKKIYILMPAVWKGLKCRDILLQTGNLTKIPNDFTCDFL